MVCSFYSEEELKELGLKEFGKNVLISRKASIYSPEKISIGNNVRIDDFCILSGKITLGNYIHVAAYSAMYAGDTGITVSDFANISSRVTIYAISDNYSGLSLTNPMVPDDYKVLDCREVVINRHVIIGSTSVVLPGSILNEGCSFGAFSLIKGEYAEWNIYAGIPAEVKRPRSKEMLKLEKKLLLETL